MYHFVVIINDSRNDEIRYVGTDIQEAVQVYEKEKWHVWDCWIEVWQKQTQLEDYWKPKENDDEVFYRYAINQSMKDVWDNEKDSLYDDEK